jgi:protein-disulfide isomerase
MSHFLRPAKIVLVRASFFPTGLAFAFVSALILMAATGARAQFSAPSAGTHIMDDSALHPPPGARVAIVEFYDLECPACAAANPTLMQAVANYKIPWIHHDLLIPGHIWSPIAAVNARWFDSKSKTLGEEYRDQVFANQNSIYNPEVLHQFTEKFAQSHGIALPFAIDPQGTFAAQAKADTELGRRMGIQATPAIFVVSASNPRGPTYREVVDRSRLFQMIDQALDDTKPIPPHK